VQATQRNSRDLWIGVPPYDKIPLQGGMKFVGAIRNPR